jgi:hypothetical protein
MKLALLQILLMMFSPLLIAEEVKLWHDGKISPEQPFKALVVGVFPSWGGDSIILQEIEGQERYCLAVFKPKFSTYAVYSKEEFIEKKMAEVATLISPGVEVERFSWSMGVEKIGKIFGEEDMVSNYYDTSNFEKNKPTTDSKLRPEENPKPEPVKQESAPLDFLTLKDPRPSIPAFSISFDNGVAPKNYTMVPNPILVINWHPPSDPKNPQLAEPKFSNTQEAWQISGLEGYFTQEEIEAILKQFYILYEPKKNILVPDLIVAGNNWASGRQIEPVIEELSKKYKFRSYHIAGAFTKATLNAESIERISLLKDAQAKVQQEVANTDQPDNAPKSKSEDKNNPDPKGLQLHYSTPSFKLLFSRFSSLPVEKKPD